MSYCTLPSALSVGTLMRSRSPFALRSVSSARCSAAPGFAVVCSVGGGSCDGGAGGRSVGTAGAVGGGGVVGGGADGVVSGGLMAGGVAGWTSPTGGDATIGWLSIG